MTKNNLQWNHFEVQKYIIEFNKAKMTENGIKRQKLLQPLHRQQSRNLLPHLLVFWILLVRRGLYLVVRPQCFICKRWIVRQSPCWGCCWCHCLLFFGFSFSDVTRLLSSVVVFLGQIWSVSMVSVGFYRLLSISTVKFLWMFSFFPTDSSLVFMMVFLFNNKCSFHRWNPGLLLRDI